MWVAGIDVGVCVCVMCFAIKPLWSSVNCSRKQAPARCEPQPAEDYQRLAVSRIHNQTGSSTGWLLPFCLRQIRQSRKTTLGWPFCWSSSFYCPQQKYIYIFYFFLPLGKTEVKIKRYTQACGGGMLGLEFSPGLKNSFGSHINTGTCCGLKRIWWSKTPWPPGVG